VFEVRILLFYSRRHRRSRRRFAGPSLSLRALREARFPGAGNKYQDCVLSIRLDIYERERASSLIYCACEGPRAESCERAEMTRR